MGAQQHVPTGVHFSRFPESTSNASPLGREHRGCGWGCQDWQRATASRPSQLLHLVGKEGSSV